MLLRSGRGPLGEGNGTPIQYSCLENPMDGGAWWAAVHGVAKSRTQLSDFTFTFHFHTLEKEMATHSSVFAWRIPGTGEPGGLPSTGSQSQTRLKRLSSSSRDNWILNKQWQTNGKSLIILSCVYKHNGNWLSWAVGSGQGGRSILVIWYQVCFLNQWALFSYITYLLPLAYIHISGKQTSKHFIF